MVRSVFRWEDGDHVGSHGFGPYEDEIGMFRLDRHEDGLLAHGAVWLPRFLSSEGAETFTEAQASLASLRGN